MSEDTSEVKMICVRLPATLSKDYKVKLRQDDKTAQGHLSDYIEGYTYSADRKPKPKAKKNKK